MNKEDFIKKLQRERTDYKYASQVRTIAKSLIQLSVGIYTEPERFVYELLQNAVDAFSDTNNDTLEILIRAEKDKFVFMHNGKPFSEKDVEGICDVGNGTKAKDSKKIGYKGIGFKSVFMPSVSRVSIVSNQFCFEFDKYKAHTLMPKFPYEDGILNPDDIPWQVIPIDAFYLKPTYDPNFNVITTIYTQEADKIGVHVENLFSDLQFLLFLSSNNVNIRFERNGQFVLSVGKKQSVGVNNMPEVMLYKNDQAQSSWMLYTKEVSVPPEVKIALENDFNTPDKLKGAEQLQISFAVQTKGNKVVALRNTPVFTFLPTSYRALCQPFLINSNFITDAGRQQLHQESEWNKLIFREIPVLYLDFVSKFSTQFANYTDVLPTLYPDSDTLVRVYRSELDRAFDAIAFVPNREGNRLLKLREVLVDKTGISKGIIPIDHILFTFNKIKGTQFTKDNLVDNNGIANYAREKVFIIKSEDIILILNTPNFTAEFSHIDNLKLINFLCNYCSELKDSADKATFEDSLRHSPILLNEDNDWDCPENIYLPSDFKEYNEQAEDVKYLNSKIFDEIKNDIRVFDWLKNSLGIKELDDSEFVDYIFSHPEYVTSQNAIDIAAFLFRVWFNTPMLIEENSNKESFKVLTISGELKSACDLFLTKDYDPKINLERVLENDMFPSLNYLSLGELRKVKLFLLALGVNEDIILKRLSLDINPIPDRFDSSFFAKIIETSKKWGNTAYVGFKINGEYTFSPSRISFYSYPLLEKAKDYDLSKVLFSRILSQSINEDIDKEIIVKGRCGYWGFSKTVEYLASADSECPTRYMEWVIDNYAILPTSLGDCRKPKDIFAYSYTTYLIAGKYLPVLDINETINDYWRQKLPFKQSLSTYDLLTILERIAEDKQTNKEEVHEKISAIYCEFIERGEQCSDSIREWSKSHTILSQSGEFLPASDLAYITVDGFKNDGNKVYCEKVGRENRKSLLQLLKTFGVKVITQKDITTNFANAYENEELKELLMDKLQYLVVLQDKGKSSFVEKKFDLENKIKNTHFYKCDSISLTYGQDNDTISKSTFSERNNFYYTGKITPVLIEPLLLPLCSHLNIGNSNDSKLMVILITNDHQSLVDYLTDCGYKVDNLSEPQLPQISGEDEIVSVSDEKIVIEPGHVSTVDQMEINKEVRIHVKPFLAAHGYDVSSWDPENSLPDLVGVIKDPNGNPINVVIRSAKQHNIHLSASSFETLMTNPNNLLIVENHQGIHTVSFEELFSNNSNVNLIFDAKYTPREYFRALGVIFKYVKNTEFIVRDPHFSVYDEIKGFGLEMKNDGTVLIGSSNDI